MRIFSLLVMLFAFMSPASEANLKKQVKFADGMKFSFFPKCRGVRRPISGNEKARNRATLFYDKKTNGRCDYSFGSYSSIEMGYLALATRAKNHLGQKFSKGDKCYMGGWHSEVRVVDASPELDTVLVHISMPDQRQYSEISACPTAGYYEVFAKDIRYWLWAEMRASGLE